jgi:hypothetical protein
MSQARGRAPFGHAFGPHRGDRSPRWIYPNLFDPDTRVANPCRPSPGIATTNAHAVTRARKNGSARCIVLYAQRTGRAAVHASSRKKRVRNCTQGAFRRRAREQFRKIARSASGPHGCPRGPALVASPFVPTAFRSVDLLRAAWARPRGFPTHEAPGIRSWSQQPRRLLRLVRPAGCRIDQRYLSPTGLSPAAAPRSRGFGWAS